MLGEFIRRFHYLLHRRRLERELQDEMAAHRELAAADGGRPFGNELRLREEARDAWGWTWLDRLGQDLRFAARLLRRAPGFTVLAVAMLALGIGANIAAFGFFNLMVLRPLPVREPETLLRFERRSPDAYASALPYPEMAFIREHTRSLSAVLALTTARLFPERDGRSLTAHFVSGNFFSELGARMAVGRGLADGDAMPDAEAVVVLSHGYWQRRYGGDPSVVGRVVHLNGQATLVIGVASPQFAGLSLESPDVWLPLERHARYVAGSVLLTDLSVTGSVVRTWGRLRPGVTPRQAEDELASLAAVLRSSHPTDIWEHERLRSTAGGYATGLMNGDRHGTGAEQTNELYPVFGLISALVLLILTTACANLGGLLLARGVAREREMVIRVSVGAGRARLVRQLLTESVLLASLGSASGLACGYWILRELITLSGAPDWLDASPDWRVVAFAMAMGWVAALLFGLAPALQAVRRRRGPTVMREVLIAVQVAASCVLVIVASLLARGITHAATMDPGFEVEQMLSVDPGLRGHGYAPERARAFFETLADRLRAVPGVASVALATRPPLGRGTDIAGVIIDRRPLSLLVNHVSPEFFATMRIELLQGRTFTQNEPRAVVVSDLLAERAWPGRRAVGQLIELGTDVNGTSGTLTVIGIVRGAGLPNAKAPDALEAYLPIGPDDQSALVALVRTSVPTRTVAASVAGVAQGIDPGVFPEVQSLRSWLDQRVRSTAYVAVSVGALGLSALALACFGIVGLVAFAVAQRTTEIGIRMALGATSGQVLYVFARRFIRPVMAGLLAGSAGAALLSQLLRTQMFGLSPLDPLTYAMAAGMFLVTATVATLVPAKRALGLDPIKALRHD